MNDIDDEKGFGHYFVGLFCFIAAIVLLPLFWQGSAFLVILAATLLA